MQTVKVLAGTSMVSFNSGGKIEKIVVRPCDVIHLLFIDLFDSCFYQWHIANRWIQRWNLHFLQIIKEFRSCNLPLFKLDLNPLPLLCASYSWSHTMHSCISGHSRCPQGNASHLGNLTPIEKPDWMLTYCERCHFSEEVLWRVLHAFILKVLNSANFLCSEPNLKKYLTVAKIWDFSTPQNICHVFEKRDCFLSSIINQTLRFFMTHMYLPSLPVLLIGIVWHLTKIAGAAPLFRELGQSGARPCLHARPCTEDKARARK